jgi:Flp pilus assembly protein TadB
LRFGLSDSIEIGFELGRGMRRLEIQIRRRDGQQRRIALDRFWSIVATLVLAVVAIAILAVALALGYLVIGVVLVVALIALVVAVLRSAWRSVRR